MKRLSTSLFFPVVTAVLSIVTFVYYVNTSNVSDFYTRPLWPTAVGILICWGTVNSVGFLLRMLQCYVKYKSAPQLDISIIAATIVYSSFRLGVLVAGILIYGLSTSRAQQYFFSYFLALTIQSVVFVVMLTRIYRYNSITTEKPASL